MNKRRLYYLILPALTIVLEALPYGAVLNFMPPPGKPVDYFQETFSYFSLTPFGLANVGPLLTAILSCVIFVVLAVHCVTGKARLLRSAKIMLCFAVVFSLLPLAFGIHFFSAVGAAISACLIAELILLCVTSGKRIK